MAHIGQRRKERRDQTARLFAHANMPSWLDAALSETQPCQHSVSGNLQRLCQGTSKPLHLQSNVCTDGPGHDPVPDACATSKQHASPAPRVQGTSMVLTFGLVCRKSRDGSSGPGPSQQRRSAKASGPCAYTPARTMSPDEHKTAVLAAHDSARALELSIANASTAREVLCPIARLRQWPRRLLNGGILGRTMLPALAARCYPQAA